MEVSSKKLLKLPQLQSRMTSTIWKVRNKWPIN